MHTEIFTNGAFGEYASPSGAVGNRALRMRIIELATGVEVILIPHSLSMVKNVTLVPNHYFFSYLAPGGESVATHVSTIVPGRVVMFNDIGGAQWASFMPAFFQQCVELHGRARAGLWLCGVSVVLTSPLVCFALQLRGFLDGRPPRRGLPPSPWVRQLGRRQGRRLDRR